MTAAEKAAWEALKNAIADAQNSMRAASETLELAITTGVGDVDTVVALAGVTSRALLYTSDQLERVEEEALKALRGSN